MTSRRAAGVRWSGSTLGARPKCSRWVCFQWAQVSAWATAGMAMVRASADAIVRRRIYASFQLGREDVRAMGLPGRSLLLAAPFQARSWAHGGARGEWGPQVVGRRTENEGSG